jgi:hypothetical protein
MGLYLDTACEGRRTVSPTLLCAWASTAGGRGSARHNLHLKANAKRLRRARHRVDRHGWLGRVERASGDDVRAVAASAALHVVR